MNAIPKQCLLAALALALGATTATAASAAGRPPVTPDVLGAAPAGTVLFDDDGGRVQIVPRRQSASAEMTDHGGPVVTDESLQIVFLGSGWRAPAQRELEKQVTKELLARHRAEAPALEDLVDPAGHQAISDLGIQHRLDELLASDRPGDCRDDGAVFVIFLAPGLESTLGEHRSSRDFAAYHNWFHHAQGVVRYVVVPFDESASRWLAAARQSLVQALINPEGNGWY